MRRFPLEALLALRAREEAGRGRELAAARAAEAARLAARDACRDALQAKAAARAARSGPAPGADARALLDAARFDARLRSQQEALRAALLAEDVRLRDAGLRVGRTREALAIARRAREGVEARREAWRLAERRRRERAAEAADDDRARPAAEGEAD